MIVNKLKEDLSRATRVKSSGENIVQSKKRFMVHPCFVDGQHTLIYESDLKKNHPSAYLSLVHYAEANGYVIEEDKRANFIEGVKRVKNPSCANVFTILILTVSLLSQNVIADNMDLIGQQTLNENVEQVQIFPRFDLQMSSFSTADQLMGGLLNWINEHTTFDHKIDQLPHLSFVNAQNITEIAFGKNLPANVNASNLHILGLYNFNAKTIYLLDSVDLNTEAGRGILLHELVHYLQYEERLHEAAECKNELEALAYSVEAQYLYAHQQDKNFSKQLINEISQCPV